MVRLNERKLRLTGIFFGSVFLAGYIFIFALRLIKGFSFFDCLKNSTGWFCIIIAMLFYISGRWSKLFWIQPAVFLVLTPVPFMQGDLQSFYGLGFFLFAVSLLFRLGFFQSHRRIKFLICIAYLLAIQVICAVNAQQPALDALPPMFFLVCFLLFFYFMFEDKLMVFLNEPKSKLSLEAKGLTDTESGYILSIISGKSVKETAFEAGVSESTVRNTIARGYKKLGLVNKSGLMALSEKYDITS